KVPGEIWEDVGKYLRPTDIASFLRVGKLTFDVGSYLLYRKIVLIGVKGRRCGLMLSSGEHNAPFYASLVQELEFFSFETVERYLNFTALAHALTVMKALRIVHFHVSTANAESLVFFLSKEGHIPPLFDPWNPCLQRVYVNSSTALLPFISHRNLTEVSLTDSLAIEGVDELVSHIHGQNLSVLRLQLKEATDPKATMTLISAACPNLFVLSLEQPEMNCKVFYSPKVYKWTAESVYRSFSKAWQQIRST
ncbi:hypothetical protein BKA70DRAFT_1100754, partial [Coprinopsis sp. MPI-PUGE-AT-0042]